MFTVTLCNLVSFPVLVKVQRNTIDVRILLFQQIYWSSESRETAFIHAINAAALAWSVTRACSKGDLAECSCDNSIRRKQRKWQWGGCSEVISNHERFQWERREETFSFCLFLIFIFLLINAINRFNNFCFKCREVRSLFYIVTVLNGTLLNWRTASTECKRMHFKLMAVVDLGQFSNSRCSAHFHPLKLRRINPDFEGAFDWPVALRCTEFTTKWIKIKSGKSCLVGSWSYALRTYTLIMPSMLPMLCIWSCSCERVLCIAGLDIIWVAKFIIAGLFNIAPKSKPPKLTLEFCCCPSVGAEEAKKRSRVLEFVFFSFEKLSYSR